MKRALTVELAAHHGDLERFEVVFHELLTIATSVRLGTIIAQNLDIGAVLGQYRRLDVDQEAHKVLLVC